MVLKALYDYYFRCKKLYGDDVPPLGFERTTLDFVIVISEIGEINTVLRKQTCIAPRAASNKTSGVTPNILHDTAKYMLNCDKSGDIPELLSEHCQSMVNILNDLASRFPYRKDFKALQLFYEGKKYVTVTKWLDWTEINRAKNISFQMEGEEVFVCSYTKEINENYLLSFFSNNTVATCIVTGERKPIVETTGGISLGKATNGKLVGFQRNRGYDSHGKTQGGNAPISVMAEFAYTQSLKMLDSKGKKVEQTYIKSGDFTPVK